MGLGRVVFQLRFRWDSAIAVMLCDIFAPWCFGALMFCRFDAIALPTHRKPRGQVVLDN